MELQGVNLPLSFTGQEAIWQKVFQGVIEYPGLDNDIRRFDANLRLFPPFIDNVLWSLTINNILLQSCYLRNREWGNEIKLGMSRGLAEPKLTVVDAIIDKLRGTIFLFQLVVVMVLGVAGTLWEASET